ncbi:MAG: hypothetical protein ACR2P0_19580 [Acidimicrobiales bacterium]
MSMLVVSNDVIPGFGVPVAAPGIRAAGLAEGFRGHGIDVDVTVPSTVLDQVWTRPVPPSPPPGVTVLDPNGLAEFIEARGYDHVVFTNANMAPHLRPNDGTTYVFDMFAPKILELLASGRHDRDWVDDARRKERALALSDHVLVNGRRKYGYALGWLLRPSVERIRINDHGLRRLVDGDPAEHVSIVEMPIPLPPGIGVECTPRAGGQVRVGMAGYTQAWSVLDDQAPAISAPLDAGFEVHVLAPRHWGGADSATAEVPDLPAGVTQHDGPLGWADFGRWVQSMHVIVDEFSPSAERSLAMITRTTVALRFGVPVIHGADSEVSDMIREHDAGWVVAPGDGDAWARAMAEAADPDVLDRKRTGARELSVERLAPRRAVESAVTALGLMGSTT